MYFISFNNIHSLRIRFDFRFIPKSLPPSICHLCSFLFKYLLNSSSSWLIDFLLSLISCRQILLIMDIIIHFFFFICIFIIFFNHFLSFLCILCSLCYLMIHLDVPWIVINHQFSFFRGKTTLIANIANSYYWCQKTETSNQNILHVKIFLVVCFILDAFRIWVYPNNSVCFFLVSIQN